MKLPIFASLSTIVGALVFAVISTSAPTEVEAADACHTKVFKTESVKKACTDGGQKAAKELMKKFMKESKLKSCNQCHAKLAPKYELKADGLAQYKKLGGK